MSDWNLLSDTIVDFWRGFKFLVKYSPILLTLAFVIAALVERCV